MSGFFLNACILVSAILSLFMVTRSFKDRWALDGIDISGQRDVQIHRIINNSWSEQDKDVRTKQVLVEEIIEDILVLEKSDDVQSAARIEDRIKKIDSIDHRIEGVRARVERRCEEVRREFSDSLEDRKKKGRIVIAWRLATLLLAVGAFASFSIASF